MEKTLGPQQNCSLNLDNKSVIILIENDAIATVNLLTEQAMICEEKIKACQTLGGDILEGETIAAQALERKKLLDHLIITIETCRQRKPVSVNY